MKSEMRYSTGDYPWPKKRYPGLIPLTIGNNGDKKKGFEEEKEGGVDTLDLVHV